MKNIKKFCTRNKEIIFLSIVSILVVISYIITSDWTEIFPGADRWYKLASDVGLGFLISTIFYIFQVFIPSIADEKKAAMLIENDINKLLTFLDHHIWLIDNCISFEGDAIIIKNKLVYFKYSNCATYYNFNNDLQIDLQVINNRCNKIASNYYFNKSDIDFIDSFMRVQGNKYIICLKMLIDNCSDTVTIPEFKNAFSDFKNAFIKLKEYNNFKGKDFTMLRAEEINFVKRIIIQNKIQFEKTEERPLFYIGLPTITK